MGKRRGRFAKIAAAVIIFIILTISVSYAKDELVLKGIIRSINSGTKVVAIDVRSQSCPGVRNFTFDSSSGLDSSMIGKKVFFKIDASRCTQNVTPKILKVSK